jgi:hypothetical protein
MARSRLKSQEAQEAESKLMEFFSENPECLGLAYSRENLVRFAIMAGATTNSWPEFADMCDKVQEFSDISLELMSQYVLCGAYSKFKALAAATRKERDTAILDEGERYPELSRTEILKRMQSSGKLHKVLENGDSAETFEDSNTPQCKL